MEETFNPSFRKTFRRYSRDAKNLFLYGSRAPLTHQLIYLNPNEIELALNVPFGETSPLKRKLSALVMGGDWDKSTIAINELPKIKACNLHFQENIDWQDSGIFDLMLDLIGKFGSFDECQSIKDIKNRYSKIDSLFETI